MNSEGRNKAIMYRMEISTFSCLRGVVGYVELNAKKICFTLQRIQN